jgi:hypothetical protein
MTRGEKTVALLLGGPAGLIVVGRNRSFTKKVARNVDAIRAGTAK